MQQHELSTNTASTTATPPKQKVLIVGSSIAGTVFALQLLTNPILRPRYRPILFDSATSLPYLDTTGASDSSHPEGQSGAAVALTKQAMYPLRQLEIGPELDEISQNTERIAIFKQPFFGPQDGSQSGSVVTDWSAPPGIGVMGGLWTIERGKLQGLLIKIILERGGEVVLNSKLINVIEHTDTEDEGAVEAVFENSRSQRGDLLVGADGAWSTVRKHIFTESSISGKEIVDERWKPDFQNLHIMHGICNAQTTDTKPTIYAMGIYGVGTGTWTLTGGRQMWTIYEAPCEPPPDDQDARDRAKEASKTLSEKWNMDVFTGGYDQRSTEAFMDRYRKVWHPSAGTFGTLFDATEKIVRVGLWQKLFTRLGNVQWAPGEKRPKECGKDAGGKGNSGNVVLIGDAARVLMPTAGQGAGFAIEDATVFADCLLNYPPNTENTVPNFSNAIKEYTRQRLPRYKKISVIADWGARIALGRTWFTKFIRDYASGWTPEPKVESDSNRKRSWLESIGGEEWLLAPKFEVKLRNLASGSGNE